MDQPLQSISLTDYAEILTLFGAKIIKKNGRYWRQVRPLFYRPILPVENLTAPDTSTGLT